MLLDWLPSGLSVSGLTEQGIALNIQGRVGLLPRGFSATSLTQLGPLAQGWTRPQQTGPSYTS